MKASDSIMQGLEEALAFAEGQGGEVARDRR